LQVLTYWSPDEELEAIKQGEGKAAACLTDIVAGIFV